MIKINEIHIKFQGGFSSSLCKLECSLSKSANQFEANICEFYPEDNNSNQVDMRFSLTKIPS